MTRTIPPSMGVILEDLELETAHAGHQRTARAATYSRHDPVTPLRAFLAGAWPTTAKALPVGARVTGDVIAQQRFGVFISIDGAPDTLGFVEITGMPHDLALPDIGTPVTGEVIWHAEHNQVELPLLVSPVEITAGPDSYIADEAPTGTAPLVHVDHVFINFKNNTFQWVDIRRFELPSPAADGASILAQLIDHELYGDDYAGGEYGGDPHRHGPYWRNRITPACFDPIDPGAAERQVRFWAEQFASVPEHLLPELEREVCQPLHSAGPVYQLCDLGPVAFHDWGGVHNEFHELVLIDHANRVLTLMVAADD